jgi:hypothetical protein
MNGLAPHGQRADGKPNGKTDAGGTGRHAQVDVVSDEPADPPAPQPAESQPAESQPAEPQAESDASRVEAPQADVAVESPPADAAPPSDTERADGGQQMVQAPVPSADPAEDESTSDGSSEEPTPHVPRPPVAVPRAPRRAEQIHGVEPAGPKPSPLELGSPVGAPPRSSTNGQREEPQARGHLCARGHLNDPRSQFCVLCGVRMNERTGVLVVGTRPPLGLLVLDDGATYTVDAEYLVGRMPEADQRVQSGMMRAIVVEDRSGAVSRVHAEIRVNGWDVLLSDSGSRNGTFVAGPSDSGWAPLPPGRSRRLVPGTRIRMGGRTFVFESPSGAR